MLLIFIKPISECEMIIKSLVGAVSKQIYCIKGANVNVVSERKVHEQLITNIHISNSIAWRPIQKQI